MPPIRALLSNFTLGFADGLTVPFALTAGLSSLGQTKTVIYAGMAEVTAGSISMGIGGYLAARSTAQAAVECPDEDEDEQGNHDADVERKDSEGLLSDLAEKNTGSDSGLGSDQGESESVTPVVEGLAVSFGYLVGGVLPLFPYFFVADVNTGLLWSFVVCVVALFGFGFGKRYYLWGGGAPARLGAKKSASWKRVRASLWEGFQMVILGSIAALAAVLCVRLFEGVV